MIRFLLRCAMFIFGVLLLVDAGLSPRDELLSVDRHVSATRTSDDHWQLKETTYTLYFVGGSTHSCSVGYAAFRDLRDGDAVGVRSTRLLRNCVSLAREGVKIEANSYWRVLGVLGGCLLIAGAVGWLRTDDDGAVLLT